MSAAYTAGATAAVIAQAIKASGAIVHLTPEGLEEIIRRQEHPLVIFSVSRFLWPSYKYLTSYKGLAFYAKAKEPLALSARCELIEAKHIWIPG
jgi:hypothetical protein